MSENTYKRRTFLHTLGRRILFLAAGLLYFPFSGFLNRISQKKHVLKLKLKDLKETEFFFVRTDHQKLRIISKKCTHLGCTVNFNENSKMFICPCHGSKFDNEGNYLSGPAKKNLTDLDYKLNETNDIEIII
ncbi:MAG: ubiquinol-cytochrome c reductase iron-sulfur subunit [Calditrichaceae bacterium]